MTVNIRYEKQWRQAMQALRISLKLLTQELVVFIAKYQYSGLTERIMYKIELATSPQAPVRESQTPAKFDGLGPPVKV